jgi:hypothetical protein
MLGCLKQRPRRDKKAWEVLGYEGQQTTIGLVTNANIVVSERSFMRGLTRQTSLGDRKKLVVRLVDDHAARVKQSKRDKWDAPGNEYWDCVNRAST